jgi:hypothetical protein
MELGSYDEAQGSNKRIVSARACLPVSLDSVSSKIKTSTGPVCVCVCACMYIKGKGLDPRREEGRQTVRCVCVCAYM